ncbi:hypothetical protein N7495_008095 [Penicillium taxi]|uniref:uncharacterized protein n=1 Tax=Penicillium taxi TaxID=168475 RepID=UPI00254510A9|nr:uncharacterized protein N7495_008095 [Penicillium taxi]KAJ5888054.1 hypothetical protein N7495_008095 [Penicillium taxi]
MRTVPNPRFLAATVKVSLGELNAEVTTSYQMVYLPARGDREKYRSATFIFTDLVESKDFHGKAGSFMSEGKGTFDASKYIYNARLA